MSEESKPVDSQATAEAVKETLAEAQNAAESSHDEDEGEAEPSSGAPTAAKSKKKKSKKAKLKAALTGSQVSSSSSSEPQLSAGQLQQVLQANPALKSELETLGGDQKKIEEMMRKLKASDLLTGMAVGGKNQKDMASHTFWKTQPVPKFEERAQGGIEEGPIKIIDPKTVPKEPAPLPTGYEWVTMDLTDENELSEVHELLSGHYVEDDEAMFRFRYSASFFDWALKSPGWRKEWHVGVRTSSSRRLVAFISGIPVDLRVRDKVLKCSEINFLCVHKKLRQKRLTPVLIKEITRRCYVVGIYQAIYTVGIILPTPVSTCRYFHRSLDWEKLYDVGFSPLPPGSTKQRQVARFALPSETTTHGLRPMAAKDIDSVLDLQNRFLDRMQMAQVYTREEIEHWLLHKEDSKSERVVWTFVVEDPESKKISDFFSFYYLPSTVIGSKKHDLVRAAYLFYYATETAFGDDQKAYKKRLNTLVKDALILAKKENFDVFNALTLMDNPLFLEEQRFGAGDGQLHFYLFNYRANPIPGGVDVRNAADEKSMGGIGVVML
ncbi:glycylpeptide N-tetradecanoyltransferase [Patellaria atrata CBS 101060]|uniref:Glycylpeptide N-tetradecanoyltransferase n=1 Tax=Patellaria atrata CBS 101060 TaxID=1346257 RepID=A0A9P4SD70_9PEZI|nr:glycylpeptide N-tetradecanoyltransferase [Patellaria atrata CBS 101060]